jgi:alkylation response protein AidB-like acyl-CoA dehydrogenase
VESPLDAARALAPLIRAAADEIEARRELPPALFDALADAGMFRLALPRSLGGAELDLPTYARVIEEIGGADASTGWIVNQVTVFSTYSARMPLEVARTIWHSPRTFVANTPAPTAEAIVVPGGYRVTGRQGFSTGCRHAAWLAAHARVVEDGRMRLEPDGQPETRYLFVPAGEAEVLDTWRVRGMRGTGTHHFEVKDVFVPAERTVHSTRAPLRETGPLYRIARTLLFGSGDASVALGMARRSLAAFVELATGKTPWRMTEPLRDQPTVQAAVGHADAQLRAAHAFLTQAIRDIWAAATAGPIALDARVALRLAATHAIRIAAQVIDTVYNAAGATAIYEGHVLQRHFQDIHVITQHSQGRLVHYETAGRHRLGLPIGEAML